MKKTLAIILSLALIICMMPTAAFAAGTKSSETDISTATVTLSKTTAMYNGAVQKPDVTVKVGTTTLTPGRDYTVSWSPAEVKNACTYTATITGTGSSYAGSKTVSDCYTITPIDLSNTIFRNNEDILDTDINNGVLNAAGQNKITATVGGVDLKNLTTEVQFDYEYNAATSTVPANVKVTVNAAGGQTNVINSRVNFFTVKTDISTGYEVQIGENQIFTYNGSAQKPNTVNVVKSGTNTALPTSAYTLSYEDNINASGHPIIKITGKGNYGGSFIAKNTYFINPKNITSPGITIAIGTGTPTVEPNVTVKDYSKTLVKGTDYQLTFVQGTNTVTIQGIGNYQGKIDRTYTLVDKIITSATIDNSVIYYYKGAVQHPIMTVIGADGKILIKGTDYTVSYTYTDPVTNKTVSTDSPKDAAIYTIYITGKGQCAGQLTRNFTIQAVPLDYVEIEFGSSTILQNGVYVPKVNVKHIAGNFYFEESDYTVEYKNINSTYPYLKPSAIVTPIEGRNLTVGSAIMQLEKELPKSNGPGAGIANGESLDWTWCGERDEDNVYYNFNEDTGEMKLSGSGGDIHWPEDIVDKVKKLIIGKYITMDTLSGVSWYLGNVEEYEIDTVSYSFSVEDGVLYSLDKTGIVAYPSSKTDKSFIIPDTVKSIGRVNIGLNGYTNNNPFYRCTFLEEIVISASVDSIYVTFNNASSRLSNFLVDENNPNYCSLDGVIFSKDMKTLVAFPCQKESLNGEYELPNTVEVINGYAFYDCQKIKKVIGNDNLKEIKQQAFSSSELEVIELQDGLQKLGLYTFDGMEKIKEITLPEGLTEIPDGCFNQCKSLKKISIPPTLVSIDQYAFLGCSALNEIDFAEDSQITEIEDRTFSYLPSLEKINLPESLERIGWGAFEGCSALKKVVIPQSVKWIEDKAFYIPGLKVIFEGKQPVMGVWEDPADTFYEDAKLKLHCDAVEKDSIIFDYDVFLIHDFENGVCSKCGVGLDEVEEDPGYGMLRYPVDKEKDQYLLFDESTGTIVKSLFFDENLEEVSIPATINGVEVKQIAGDAFNDSTLKKISLPVSTVFTDGFKLDSLKEFVFTKGNGVHDYDAMETLTTPWYKNRDKGTSIQFEEGVDQIGSYMCAYQKVDSYNLPSSLKKIGNNAFYRNDNLVSVEMKEGTEQIGYESFADCERLETITFPKTLSKIKYNSFAGDEVLVANVYVKTYGKEAADKYNIPYSVIYKGDVPIINIDKITVSYNGKPVSDTEIKGIAQYDGKTIEGTWTFKKGQELTKVEDSGTKVVVFTPADLDKYAEVEANVEVVISQATPTGTVKFPSVSESGKKLSEIIPDVSKLVPAGGTFAWVLGGDTEIKANQSYEWTYTPKDEDLGNYQMLSESTVLWKQSAGAGGFIPAAQPVKVTIQSVENGKLTLNPASPTIGDKVIITITPKEGYVVEDVLVDGKSVGAVTYYTVDKASANLTVSATFKKAEEPSETLIAQIKDTKIIARSKTTKIKGKKAVKVYWYAEGGNDLTFDGYEVFRSVKRNSGFGKKPYFSTKNKYYYNTKALKSGTKYYYKVRAYKIVDGKKVYTLRSKKAWRTVK